MNIACEWTQQHPTNTANPINHRSQRDNAVRESRLPDALHKEVQQALSCASPLLCA